MDIHKPKAIRNWREFLKEYAIIVVGVLTALAAEQAAETWNKHQRAAEAHDSIHAEIARNLAYMNVRNNSENCISRRLDEVDGLIASLAAGKLPPEPIWIGQTQAYAMDDGVYKAATQAGSVSLLPRREQGGYANLYSMFDIYWQQGVQEYAAWADLRTLEKHPPPSAVLDWQLRSAVQKARTARWAMELTRTVAIRDAQRLGIEPGKGFYWPRMSACIPLNTSREEAQKIIAKSGISEETLLRVFGEQKIGDPDFVLHEP